MGSFHHLIQLCQVFETFGTTLCLEKEARFLYGHEVGALSTLFKATQQHLPFILWDHPKKWYQHRPQTVQVNQFKSKNTHNNLACWLFLRRSIQDKHKDIMKTWRRRVQCRPYTQSPICAQPGPARPPKPNPTPNPAQRAQHGQIPLPTQPSAPRRAKSAPNTARRAQHGQIPLPTQPSAPRRAKSAPNTARRAQHGQIPLPTQPSAPRRAKSAPNTARRAHQRVQSLFF